MRGSWLLISFLSVAAVTGSASRAIAVPSTANAALSGYASYVELEKQLAALAESPLVKVDTLASTLGDRKLRVITIGTGKVHEKPAILVVGNVQASHLVGSELALRMAQKLVAAQAKDAKIAALLDRCTFYFIPRPNPDGSEQNFVSVPFREHHGNNRKTDDDRDFSSGEDPPDDLNADGLITLMRVADDTGTFKPHPDDPRVLIEVDPKKNERGAFKIFPEGLDDDHDEKFNEDGGDGVNFNRNFAFRYPAFEPAAGAIPNSEIESRAVADFAFDHPNIALVFCFSPEDNLMQPWKPAAGDQGKIKTSLQAGDQPYYQLLAEKYQKLHGGKDAPASPAGAGSFSEWAYYHYGRWSLAARGWWVPKLPLDEEAKKKASGETRGEDDLNALRYFAKEGIDGFVPWTPIEHPQFPGKKVEVGGFKPHYRLNPPAKELDGLAEKHFSYLQELVGLLPKLEIRAAKAEPLGGGVFRVSYSLVNVGYLPTMCEMGKTTGENYPLQTKLETPPAVKFVQGSPRTALPRLEGNGGQTEQFWIVRTADAAPQRCKLRAWAPAVGAVETELELK